jgi:hypothetical protein
MILTSADQRMTPRSKALLRICTFMDFSPFDVSIVFLMAMMSIGRRL